MCELSRPCPPTWAAAHTTPANGLVLIGSRMPTAGSTLANNCTLHTTHYSLPTLPPPRPRRQGLLPDQRLAFLEDHVEDRPGHGLQRRRLLSTDAAERGASSNLGRANGTDITVSSFVHVSIYAGGAARRHQRDSLRQPRRLPRRPKLRSRLVQSRPVIAHRLGGGHRRRAAGRTTTRTPRPRR
jgi:hypothetical protein